MAIVLKKLPAFARRHPRYKLCAIVERCLGVAGTKISSDALHQDACVCFNEDSHEDVGVGKFSLWGDR